MEFIPDSEGARSGYLVISGQPVARVESGPEREIRVFALVVFAEDRVLQWVEAYFDARTGEWPGCGVAWVA